MFIKPAAYVIALSWLACSLSSLAQVPPEVRERLASSNVVNNGAHVYAISTGVIRGTKETSEEFQVTRAMRTIANRLCEFEPTQGKRLEASITGVTLMSAITRGKDMEVVIRVPTQQPLCRVVVVESEQLAAPAKPDTAKPDEFQTRITSPSYVRSKDIVIRIFGGEY
jgi:hypothetical protein